MSYSCLNMDDLNDQLNLETVNLCLKTENTEIETDQIPGVNLLNNFLLSFDLFRGSFFEGTNFTGFFIPYSTGNILNGELYYNIGSELPYTDQMINLTNFIGEFYFLALTYISVFEFLNEETYIIAKELLYGISIKYLPNLTELLAAEDVPNNIFPGPKGVFRKSVEDVTDTTILFLDSVTDIYIGMYVRGPKELDYGGDFPITDPTLLPRVLAVDGDNTTVTISLPTDVQFDSLIVFGFPEFCSWNFQDTGEYPKDSYEFVIPMKNRLQKLVNYLENEVTFKTDVTDITVVDDKFTFVWGSDISDTPLEAPAESLVSGITYRFDQTDKSNLGRPLQFSTTEDGTHPPDRGVAYTDNVTTVGIPGFSDVAYTEIKVTDDTPDILYYFSPNLPRMGNALTIVKSVPSKLKSATLLANNNIVVEYDNALFPTDWVGIYKENDAPRLENTQLWLYVGGTQEPTDLGNGSLLFDQSSADIGTIPLPSGNYLVYFFEYGFVKSIGTSLELTIP